MNLQAEKIELIKQIADINSEKVIRIIKDALAPFKKNEKIEYSTEQLLTKETMQISEQVLKEVWKNERDDEWAQYLKD